RQALGKTMVEIGVERDGKTLGSCRMQGIEDARPASLRRFFLAPGGPGTVVVTDGWRSCQPACGDDYIHQPEPISPSASLAHELLPGVHRVASVVQRWLLGTHQGGVKPGHLQAYLDEFTFRFNRRHSRARGMLFYRPLEHAVQAPPRTWPQPPTPPIPQEARPTGQPRGRASRSSMALPLSRESRRILTYCTEME